MNVNPNASSSPGPGYVTQHQSGFQYGLGGQTINGTQYSAGIQQDASYNNTGLNTFNPSYLASLNLSVTQPLLKNFGMNAAKRQYKLSFVNEDASTAQAMVDASNTISQVEDAYWNLVSAWRNVAIQESGAQRRGRTAREPSTSWPNTVQQRRLTPSRLQRRSRSFRTKFSRRCKMFRAAKPT